MNVAGRLTRFEEGLPAALKPQGPSPFFLGPGHLSISTYIPLAMRALREDWPTFIDCPRCSHPQGTKIHYLKAEHVSVTVSHWERWSKEPDRLAAVVDELNRAGFTLAEFTDTRGLAPRPRQEAAFDAIAEWWVSTQQVYFPFCFVNGDQQFTPADKDGLLFRLRWLSCEPTAIAEGGYQGANER